MGSSDTQGAGMGREGRPSEHAWCKGSRGAQAAALAPGQAPHPGGEAQPSPQTYIPPTGAEPRLRSAHGAESGSPPSQDTLCTSSDIVHMLRSATHWLTLRLRVAQCNWTDVDHEVVPVPGTARSRGETEGAAHLIHSRTLKSSRMAMGCCVK